MKNAFINGISIFPVIFILLLTTNSYSQDYMVNKKSASSEDLEYYNIETSTFEYKVHFDSFNKKAASQAISHLQKIYNEVLKYYKLEGHFSGWADIAFVNKEDYKSPALGNTRWVIQNKDSTKLTASAKSEIYSLIPHEQVHALQQQFGGCEKLPRWFEEGQAVWIEYKVLSNIDPKKWDEQNVYR